TALRELVAKALVNKGFRLGQMNRNEDEIAVYDEVVKRYGEAPETALRELVAKALVNKGIRLGQMNRNEDAIAVYDEVVNRYGDAPEAVLREQVAMALNGKGFRLLCRAKQCWSDGAARRADMLAAAALFERAVNDHPDKPIVWGNQAYAAFLHDQSEAARPLLRQTLQQGGERLYQGTLSDLKIHPVPPDEAYRAMLDELWAEVKPQS
ncbi:MAG TPA: tetratricopeptide repeat protein, partial [Gallionella sp.]|nr:tetratricopeptide repeat protein [Gallionella sp.]